MCLGCRAAASTLGAIAVASRRHVRNAVSIWMRWHKAAFVAGKGRLGSPRLVLDLADAGEVYDRKTVANSQQRQGLRAKAARKFKATTNSNHTLPVAPNLLQQNFTAVTPRQKWVGDISVPQQAA